ncbi:MAG TPA: leucine--tRNA ligase, partial [Tepidisphaeraceae bacterium]
HINPVQEGLENVAGDPSVLRKWSTFTPAEQRDIIDGLRLAYTDEVPVNWCPGLGTVLANEEVIDGRSEVGGYPVERRPMRQWMLRITAYADRLIADLDGLEWPHSLKEMQRNWIGRSVGAEVDFTIAGEGSGFGGQGSVQNPSSGLDPEPRTLNPDLAPDDTITVFTTRPDTLFGATYMVLAPEHELVDAITTSEQRAAVDAYRAMAKNKSERERQQDVKEKTGVFTGAYAINPVNREPIPIWIADYVLTGYGTGAIMAVPAHDERDFAFSRKFGLPIVQVVAERGVGVSPTSESEREQDAHATEKAFTDEGVAINSDYLNGLTTAEAKAAIIDKLEADGVGHRRVNYKLRDWLFSRQRYWGEPFPIVLDADGNHSALLEEELPVLLPQVDDFKPTGTPDPPLSKVTEWVKYSDTLSRETNTMPQWAGSCWYYLRYIDPRNATALVDSEKEAYWMPVDLYVGGVEHAVLHLLYARFWHKVLFDLGHVSTPEPFQRLVNQGLILGETEYHFFERQNGPPVSAADVKDIGEEATDQGLRLTGVHKATGEKLTATRVIDALVEKKGDRTVLRANNNIAVDARSFKMSKSRGNVVNPDEIVAEYGADTFRLYEMYMGPLEQQKPWNTRDIVGMWRFLHSVWRNLIGDADEGSGFGVQGSAKNTATSDPHPEPRTLNPFSDTPIKEITRRSHEAIAPEALDRLLHRTIRKVGEDIEAMRFNTAIAELIKFNNELSRLDAIPAAIADTFTVLLAPFAPHMAEEIWNRLGFADSVTRADWPQYDPAKLIETTIELPVQVNGKLRDKITVAADADETSIFAAAESREKITPWIAGKTIRKRVYVPKKMVSYVVG